MKEENKFFVKWLLKKWFVNPVVETKKDFLGIFKKHKNLKITAKERMESLKKFVRKPIFYESFFWAIGFLIVIYGIGTGNYIYYWFLIPCGIMILFMKIWHYKRKSVGHWKHDYRIWKQNRKI